MRITAGLYRTAICTRCYFYRSHRAERWRLVGLPGNGIHSLCPIDDDADIAYEDVVLKLDVKLLRELGSFNNVAYYVLVLHH